MTILIILVALVIANVVPTVAGAHVARALGVGVPKVSLGVWRPKLLSRLGHSLLVVTPWQIASSFALKERSTFDLYPDTPGRFFDDVHPFLRFSIALAGPLFLLAATFPILGAQTAASLVDGFSQIFVGAFGPFSYAQELLSGFSQMALDQPVTSVAVVVTKLVAFALLPLPPNAGGSALLQLVRWRRVDGPSWSASLQHIGILAILAISASWVCAVIVFVVRDGAF